MITYFTQEIEKIKLRLKLQSNLVHTEKWQGLTIQGKPEMATFELMNVSFKAPMSHEDLGFYAQDIKPNLPWADDHFLERVGGEPLNPGVQWEHWPFGKSAARFLDKNGQFTHSYMERFWPKYAGKTPYGDHTQVTVNKINTGTRYPYGDLNDVVNLLAQQPLTRQAYLPIFFPEDTGAVHGGRIPCTLGYHFMMRSGFLHMHYPLRSCDFLRHFRDDIYMAVRLLLWILDRLREKDPATWANVRPGFYSMWMGSLHIFKADYHPLFGVSRSV